LQLAKRSTAGRPGRRSDNSGNSDNRATVVTEDRRLEVLKAIVEDFIATNEPVGSKTLADRHNLGVSPATIRNDMAALEEEGLIAQPHTSAGRVPTDAGYRLFVDRLTMVKPLSAVERRAIHSFLDEAVDLDDVLRRAVRTLAQLTRNVAVVQYPSLSRSRVRHIELVALNPSRLMVVLITDTGRVEQRVVELPEPVSADTVADLRNTLNQRLHDRLLAEAPAIVSELPASMSPQLRGLMSTLIAVLIEALLERPSDRVVLGGTANLTEHAQDLTVGSVTGFDPDRRQHRQRERARGSGRDVGGRERVRRPRVGARRGRGARPPAHGLRPHNGPGRRGRALRRRPARRALSRTAFVH
jgi:heat-inducible transcriptional repressor